MPVPFSIRVSGWKQQTRRWGGEGDTHKRSDRVTLPPLFTRIPFTIDPLCTRLRVVGSPFPSLLGLFIRLPRSYRRAFQSSPRHSSPSFLRLFPVLLAPFLRACQLHFLSLSPQQLDARQQGRLYVLPRLSAARLPRFFPNLLSNLATTDTRQRRVRNAMRSNRTLPCSVTDLKSAATYGRMYMERVEVCVTRVPAHASASTSRYSQSFSSRLRSG